MREKRLRRRRQMLQKGWARALNLREGRRLKLLKSLGGGVPISMGFFLAWGGLLDLVTTAANINYFVIAHFSIKTES